MGQPTFPQGLEATPAVVRPQFDAEQIPHLPVEVGQVATGMDDGAYGKVTQLPQSFRQHPQHHTLAGAGVTGDQGKAPFTDQSLFDTPAEAFYLRCGMQGFDGQFRREGVPFEAIQGKQFLVHVSFSEAGWGR